MFVRLNRSSDIRLEIAKTIEIYMSCNKISIVIMAVNHVPTHNTSMNIFYTVPKCLILILIIIYAIFF